VHRPHPFHRTPAVDGRQARDLVREGAPLVDVREDSEWEAGHAPEALHVPLGRFAEDAPSALPAAGPVVVVCRSGNRSRAATDHLRELGYEAVNLSGGMHAWVEAGGDIVDRAGARGVVA
jgi:rhodanese-related sulfurtransferase